MANYKDIKYDFSGENLTALNATQLTSGTTPDARYTTLPAVSGANLTSLTATNLSSGTVPTARLGTGTASSSTVLYGDQTYKAEPGGGKILQVVQAITTSASTHNTTSYTASNVFGSITPTAASSKIFVSVFWMGATTNSSSTIAGGSVKIYRDIEAAGYAALFPSSVGSISALRLQGASGDLGLRVYENITYLDSPSYTLTDVITYKLYGVTAASWGSYFICPDGDSASIVMMEVAA